MRRFLRFGLVGAMSNLTLFLVFLGVVWLGAWPWLASGVLYVVGLVANYFLHRHFSFGSDATHRRDIPSFATAYGLGLVATVGIVYLLAPEIGPPLSQVVATISAAVVIYTTLVVLKFGDGEALP